MAFVENFSVSQTIGVPESFTLTDTSTGSNVLITQRRVYLQKSDGTYLVPSGTTTDYIEWDWVDSTILLDVLDKDYALSILVQWLNVSDAVLYAKTTLSGFSMYNNDFNYSLVYDEANGLASLNSQNWLFGRMKLYVALNDATTSVVSMNSITNGQAADDRGTYLRLNPNLFY